MILKKDRNSTLITHLSGFGSHFFPLGSIIIPFIIREIKKNESPFFDELTKKVINFNLSYFLYATIVKLLVIPIFVGSFFKNVFTNDFNIHIYSSSDSDNIFGIISFASILSLLAIVKMVLIIKAAINANKGLDFDYPYTIQFLK